LIKNNLKSLLIHVTISAISIFVYMVLFTAQPKFASAQAARNFHNSRMFLSITMIAISAFLYYLLGKKHLTSQRNIYKNLFSVSLPLIFGALLWANAFNIDRIGPSNHLLNSSLWQFYTEYNGYSLFFLYESSINNPYVFLIFSFIPTIAMWTGVQRKRS